MVVRHSEAEVLSTVRVVVHVLAENELALGARWRSGGGGRWGEDGEEEKMGR